MNKALQQLTTNFTLLKLHIAVQLKQPATLPAFKGSMWHGLLGRALKNHDENLYHIFYGEHQGQQPKPYALCPSADHKTEWQKGELISFELTLFGEACVMATQIIEALTQGEKNKTIGIGEQKIPFRVVSISSVTPEGLQAGIHPRSLSAWLSSLPTSASHNALHPQIGDGSAPHSEIALNFQTPVMFKQQSKALKSLDKMGLEFYIKQILRRLTQLSQFWVMDEPALFDEIHQHSLNQQAMQRNQCEVTTHCYFEDSVRYSAIHQKEIPISGVKGQVSFYGNLTPLVPIFKIGELLQVGGKSTFGLGKYQLIC